MAEVGSGLARRWLVVVGLSLTLGGLAAAEAAASAGDAEVAARVERERGLLLIHDAGPGASVADPPGPSVIVRLARPPSGRPVVVQQQLGRWLEDIVVNDRAMEIRGRLNVVIRRLTSKVGTITLELRDRPGRPLARRVTARRPIADEPAKVRARTFMVEPAAGPSAVPAVAPMPAVVIDGPAAVFEREGVVWIATGGNRPPAAPEPTPGLEVLTPAAGASGHALRLRLTGLVPVVRSSNGGVQVEFRPGKTPIVVPMRLVHGSGSATLRLLDPDVGDELEVELARIPHAASPAAWIAPGLELLPSWLGRAARRTSESATADVERVRPSPAASRRPQQRPPVQAMHERTEPSNHAVVAPVSPTARLDDEVHPAEPEPPSDTAGRGRVPLTAPVPHESEIESDRPPEAEGRTIGGATELHLARLAELGEAGRAEARRRALAAVAADPAAPEPRLELVQLLLADALATEAAAVLESLRRRGHAAAVAPGVEAAIALLEVRVDEAAPLLGQASDDPETALWRAFMAASRDEPDACIAEWERSGGVLWRYPEPLRRRLAVPIATCILDTGRLDVTLAMLDRLKPSLRASTVRQQAGALHLRATALARDGRWSEAERAFAAAIGRGDPLTSVRAAFDGIVAAHEAGQLPAGGAFEEMAGQAAAWRGHPDEAVMLDRLARMAGQAGRPAQALATWRRALDRAPDHPALAGTLDAMQEVLASALRDADDEIRPIPRLALAMSWRKLPWTEEIRALALRVADHAADQGAPSAALSLSGETAAAPVRARWQLLAGDPAGALATMRSASRPMPAAQAAVAAGRPDEALALLRPARDGAAASGTVDTSRGIRQGGHDEAGNPSASTAATSLPDSRSGVTASGSAADADVNLVDAVDALATIDGPAGGVAPKLSAALTTLRRTLESATEP